MTESRSRGIILQAMEVAPIESLLKIGVGSSVAVAVAICVVRHAVATAIEQAGKRELERLKAQLADELEQQRQTFAKGLERERAAAARDLE